MVIPVNYNINLTNVIYVCKKANNENDGVVYSDNKNTITLDFFGTGRQKKF